MSATFDTLEYVNQLKAVDVPDAQAQVQARALWQALDGRDQAVMALEQQLKSLEANRAQDAGQMATKEDLRLMATKEDLRLMATKEDLRLMATKEDLRLMATKEDLRLMASKEDLRLMATKEDLHQVQADLRNTQADVALMRKDMEMMRKDLVIKIGSMFGVSVGLIIAAIGMAVGYLA